MEEESKDVPKVEVEVDDVEEEQPERQETTSDRESDQDANAMDEGDADGDVEVDADADADTAEGEEKEAEAEKKIRKKTSSSSGLGHRNQSTNTTFTIWHESGPDGNSKVSLSIEDNNKENRKNEDEGDNESLYQTVLMGNDSMTGCAILDSNSKFGNLSIINPPTRAGGVPSTGQFSMQAHAGSMEELHRDRGDRRGREQGYGGGGSGGFTRRDSKPLNLWPSSADSKNFEYDDYSGEEQDEGDGIYPYPALTDMDEGLEMDLKDFEEQERAICGGGGSLGFDMDRKTWNDYDDEMRVMKPSRREVSFNTKAPATAAASRPGPGQVSRAVQVQFNESSIIYRSAGPSVAVQVPIKAKGAPPRPPTRSAPAPPVKFVEKAFLSTTMPMQSRKTATTELRFYSAQKPMIRGTGSGDSRNRMSNKAPKDKDHFMKDIHEEEVYQVPINPKPLRREKLEAFTYTPEPKKMAAHQTAFFSGMKKKCNHGQGEGGVGHGLDEPHSCYICAPVPEEAIAVLKDKIGLSSNEARRAGYLFLTYLKDQRHTEQVQKVMRYLQPDIFEGRHPGFSSRLNTKM